MTRDTKRWLTKPLPLVFALALAGAATPSLAQKSKDTLRMPLVRNISTYDPYIETGAPNRFMAENIHDALLGYDEGAEKVTPLLAKSWRQTSPTTLELDLRDDVKWHDGEKFTADDVAYFYGWLTDKKTKIRSKQIWAWMKKIEKLGPYKIRITTSGPAPWHLPRLAYEHWVYPKHIHSKLKDKSEFGRPPNVPIGTGQYKAVSSDKVDGLRLTQNKDYRHGGTAKPLNNITNVFIKHIPDVQTQIAGMLTGQWDVLTDVGADEGRTLAQDPRFEMKVLPTVSVAFATMDANGLSPDKKLMDKRVRQAFFMGVDRGELEPLYWGADKIGFSTDNLCYKFMKGCDYDERAAIKYDPARAKQLLAEAGYPNGLDLEISTASLPEAMKLANALAGQLLKIGIRAKVDGRAFTAYLRKERQKQATIRMSVHSPRIPDIVGTSLYFFDARSARNHYYLDEKAADLTKRINREMDPEKRKALTRDLLAYNAEQAFVLPIATNAANLIHTKEVAMTGKGRFELFGFFLRDLSWK